MDRGDNDRGGGAVSVRDRTLLTAGRLAEEFLREDVERNKPSQLIEAVQAFGDALE